MAIKQVIGGAEPRPMAESTDGWEELLDDEVVLHIEGLVPTKTGRENEFILQGVNVKPLDFSHITDFEMSLKEQGFTQDEVEHAFEAAYQSLQRSQLIKVLADRITRVA
jgi:hypothetical protein